VPASTARRATQLLTIIGTIVTLAAAVFLGWAGFHHDAAGTGPSTVETFLSWGALAGGLVLLLAAAASAGRR
jgi:hypothetical protein